MKQNGTKYTAAPELRVHGKEKDASFQVIVLGNSGGPREDNVTGLLVRASQSEWRKGSVIAVDAGALLASIIRILQREMPRSSAELPPLGYKQLLDHGPFAGIKFPSISAKANALYIFRELLHSVLITHPHLDHCSGIVVNTPALEYGREAKAIYGLPSTIDAIKNHLFNDWMWPNLSDEDHGVGFVTFRRLVEGGNPRLGSGDARGYINVCDGLATKCWGVSHGKCRRRTHNVSHQRGESFGWGGNDYNFASRRMSRMSDDHGYFAALEQHHRHHGGSNNTGNASHVHPPTPGLHSGSQPPSAVEGSHMFEPVSSSAYFIRNDEDGKELLIFGDVEPDSVSMSPRNHIIWDDAATKFVLGNLKAIFIECSYDDSTHNEDLHGHLCPRHLIAELTFLAHSVLGIRNYQQNITSKDTIDNGIAEADASQFPVTTLPQPDPKRKRKRGLKNGDIATTPDLAPVDSGTSPSPQPMQSSYVGTRSTSHSRRKTSHPPTTETPLRIVSDGVPERPASRPSTPGTGRGRAVQFQASSAGTTNANVPSAHALASPTMRSSSHHHPLAMNVDTQSHSEAQVDTSPKVASRERLPEPLKGLSVHVIHVKDTLMDGPSPGDVILGQLKALEAETGLGVEFDVCSWGESIWV